jgi:DNA polymerase III subunit delta
MSGKLFLICGDDDYLVNAAAQERVHAIIPESERTFGLEIIDGRCDNGDQVEQKVKTCMESVQMPGFASSKLTWLQDANFLTGGGRVSESAAAKESVAKLAEWLADGLQAGQNLVITTPKILKTSIIFKACQKIGEVIDFGSGLKSFEKEKNAAERLETLLKQAGLEMGDDARTEFLSRVGPETRLLVQELEKLGVYLSPNVIATVADIRAITSIGREAEPWDVLEAIGNRDAKALVLALHAVSGQKGIGIWLASMLEKSIRDLIVLREALDRKWVFSSGWSTHLTPEATIMLNNLPVNPKVMPAWAVRKKVPHAQNYTMDELRAARFRILEMREKMVSTALPEMFLLESTLLRIIGKPKPQKR